MCLFNQRLTDGESALLYKEVADDLWHATSVETFPTHWWSEWWKGVYQVAYSYIDADSVS